MLVLSTSTTGSSRRVPPPRGSRLAVPARDNPFVFSCLPAGYIQGVSMSGGFAAAGPSLVRVRFPSSLPTSSFLPASTRGGYVFQGVRTCFPGAVDAEFGHRNSYVLLTESPIHGDPVNRGVRTSFPGRELSTSSTSLFPRPAQLRCTSPSRSATARSRCPRSFGPEASFTEWLGLLMHADFSA